MQGTIIHGTMRTQDLVPAFLDALRTYSLAEYEQIAISPFSLPPAYAVEDEDSEWWESDDCYIFLDELFELLNDVAPDGFYFGAHPGDGSDYGFWTIDDNI